MSSVMILLLLLVRRTGKSLEPKLIRVLWLLILVKMVVPIGIESDINVLKYLSGDNHMIIQPEQQFVPSGNASVHLEQIYEGKGLEILGGPTYVDEQVGTVQPSYDWIIWIWLVGVVALSVYFVTMHIIMHFRIIRHLQPVKGYEYKLMKQSCQVVGIKGKVELYQSEACHVPVATGLIRSRVIIPSNLINELSKEEVKQVLIHELVHIKSRDPLVLVVALILQIGHWFNPVTWFGFKTLRDDLELYCDDKTLSLIGAKERGSYGLLLVKLAERLVKPRTYVRALSFVSPKKTLARRVIMISKFKTKKTLWSAGAFILVLSGVIYLFSGMMINVSRAENDTTDVMPEVKMIEAEEESKDDVADDKEDTKLLERVDEVDLPNETAVIHENELTFIAPVSYGRLTQPFGQNGDYYHHGIDFAMPIDTEIKASAGGIVIEADEIMDGYGIYVLLQHEDGYTTLYAHCNALMVEEGDEVVQGELIALSGNTGRSTGPHLHFELRKDGESIDPAMIFGDLIDE